MRLFCKFCINRALLPLKRCKNNKWILDSFVTAEEILHLKQFINFRLFLLTQLGVSHDRGGSFLWTAVLRWQIPLFYQFSSVVSDSWWPHGLQDARPPCPSPTPRAYSNSCPLSQWCHLTISSSVVPFFSCLQSFPESGSFQVSQFFASGGQSISGITKTKFSSWKGSWKTIESEVTLL